MTNDPATLFRRYAERYMAGDAEAVADLCGTPFLAVRSGVPIHLPDRAALLEHLGGLMAAYRAAGAAVAEIASLDELQQGGGAAFVTVRWNVRAADGSLVRDFRTSYQLVGRDDRRILSYVNHDTLPAEG